jgi:hypothetical protein
VNAVKDLSDFQSCLFCSLFDTGPERYAKLYQNATKSIITQIGLSLFVQDDHLNYSAHTYNFYVCPRSCASLDERFVCQASSLEFLARHSFDFNKVQNFFTTIHRQCVIFRKTVLVLVSNLVTTIYCSSHYNLNLILAV